MIRLIVGLGNPGKSYNKTRHNAGVWVIEQLCQIYHIALRNHASFQGQYTDLVLREGRKIHLLFPTTFMNHSGPSVRAIAHYYKIMPEEMLIVHDELDFPPGVARLKLGGGSGGHNGLKSIMQYLRGDSFWRLRIGIGHPKDKLKVPDYVLQAPCSLELHDIQHAIRRSVEVLPDFCLGKIEQAIQCLHSQAEQ